MQKCSELVQELFQNPSKDFLEHLRLNENHRIIFSGRYGTGKTTFLRCFFSRQENEGIKYNHIHLFPVHYSVSSNADIFEYIKYDIIAHLLGEAKVKIEEIEISYLKTLPEFLLRRPADVIAPFLHLFSGIGKAHEGLMKLVEEFDKVHKEVQKDDSKALIQYLQRAQRSTGGIYENDFYTDLIQQLLEQWKENDDQTENVLIIDDLDRIDPHHIFRLFNVFAAHFDVEDSSYNKFGFDKVIFVCDIDNIRQIFKSNYGADVDFNGYIDKFYSKQVYYFDNIDSVYQMIKPFMKRLSFRGYNESHTALLNSDDVGRVMKDHITYILSTMWRAGAINLRGLLKFSRDTDTILLSRNKTISLSREKEFKNWEQHVVMVLETINQFIGNTYELLLAFNKCEKFIQNQSEKPEGYDFIIGSIVAFLGYNNSFKSSEELRYPIPGHEVDIKFSLDTRNHYSLIYANFRGFDNKQDDLPGPFKNPNLFFLYKLVLQELISVGYLK